MGKALIGTHATQNSLRLLDEVRVLRARVAELERALAAAEAARDAHSEPRPEPGETLAVEEPEPIVT